MGFVSKLLEWFQFSSNTLPIEFIRHPLSMKNREEFLEEGSRVMGTSCFCVNLPPGLIQERGPGCDRMGTSKTRQKEVAEEKEN